MKIKKYYNKEMNNNNDSYDKQLIYIYKGKEKTK